MIAAKLMELVEEAGFPPGVINYLPSRGRTIGDYLVQHPRTRFINFTGSKDVGLKINLESQSALRSPEPQLITCKLQVILTERLRY